MAVHRSVLRRRRRIEQTPVEIADFIVTGLYRFD